MKAALSYAAIALMGAIVALVGAGAHRSYGWLGLALSLTLVATASVFSRAWLGFGGLGVFGTVWAVLTTVLAQEGPGASFLIAGDAHGLAWTVGGAVIVAAVAFVPRRLLGDTRPVPPAVPRPEGHAGTGAGAA